MINIINNNISSDKEMSELFLKLYNGCIKYKEQKEKKDKIINCDYYYKNYEYFKNKDLKA